MIESAGLARQTNKFLAVNRSVGYVLIFVSFLILCRICSDHLVTAASYEYGDLATNAIQIIDAKHFGEILGNYSRWGFHHPGPAFFYVYAMAEELLFDALHLVPSPHNAHVIASLVLQAACLGISVVIAASWWRRRAFVVWLLLGAAIHFGFANHLDFGNIWPPFVLAFPTILLLVTAISVAGGSSASLPLMIFAACLLIHGHVAQPLMTLPVVAVSYFLYFSKHGRQILASKSARMLHVACLLIVSLFLAPLVQDALAGAHSNLSKIVDYASVYRSDRKGLTGAIRYIICFFMYQPKVEVYAEDAGKFITLIKVNWPFIVAWLAALIVPVWFFHRYRRQYVDEYGRVVLIYRFLGLFFALTGLWAINMHGEMYQFNGFFLFGAMFVGLIPLSAMLAYCVNFDRLKGAEETVFVLAIAIAYIAISLPPAADANSDDGLVTVSHLNSCSLVHASTRSTLVLFKPHLWPIAASVILALDRAGHRFAVEPNWGFVFKDKYASTSIYDDLMQNQIEVWRVTDAKHQSGCELQPGCWLLGHQSPKLDLGRSYKIDTTPEGMFLCGWTEPGKEYSSDSHWYELGRDGGLPICSMGRESIIDFSVPETSGDRTVLSLVVVPFVNDSIARQRGEIYCNGKLVLSQALSKKTTIVVPIDPGRNLLRLIFPDAARPCSVKSLHSLDMRRFAWAIESFKVSRLER